MLETKTISQGMPRTRGRPRTMENGVRFHISLPAALAERLQVVQHQTHAGSIADVVKSALQLYVAAVEEHQAGGHVYFKRKDEDRERQLALFI